MITNRELTTTTIKYSKNIDNKSTDCIKSSFDEKVDKISNHTEEIFIESNQNQEKKTETNYYTGTITTKKKLSDEYIKNLTMVLITKMLRQFKLWSDNLNDRHLIYISTIKDLLDEYKDNLLLRDENKLLISFLYMIYQNNNWEEMSQNDIKKIILELKRFDDGIVNYEKLRVFAQQVYRHNITIFKNINYETEEEKQN